MVRYSRLIVLSLLAFAGAAHTAQFPNLYQAEIEVTDQSAAARPDNLKTALDTILVRVLGTRDLEAIPQLADVRESASSLMLSYSFTGDGRMRVAFDGAALERLLANYGLPYWGKERPATLLWLAVDSGRGDRRLLSADDAGEAKQLLLQVASDRGIPIVLPLLDVMDHEALSFADVWGGFRGKIMAASERYAVDAVLVGRVNIRQNSLGLVRWSLYFADASAEWRSTLQDGVERTADVFCRELCGDRLDEGEVMLAVHGLNDLSAYGDVSRYLESLTSVESVFVDRVDGNTVFFRLDVSSDIDRLRRAISLGKRLVPEPGIFNSANPRLTASLNYRYRP